MRYYWYFWYDPQLTDLRELLPTNWWVSSPHYETQNVQVQYSCHSGKILMCGFQGLPCSIMLLVNQYNEPVEWICGFWTLLKWGFLKMEDPKKNPNCNSLFYLLFGYGSKPMALWDQNWGKYHRMGPPSYVCWFINYEITTINYSYIYHKPS